MSFLIAARRFASSSIDYRRDGCPVEKSLEVSKFVIV
jgi:hypothetical protein